MIRVYTLPDCISCELTKRAFDRRGVEFEEVPLTDELAQEFRSKGYLSAPIVVTDTLWWYGLKPAAIQEVCRDAALGRPDSHGSA